VNYPASKSAGLRRRSVRLVASLLTVGTLITAELTVAGAVVAKPPSLSVLKTAISASVKITKTPDLNTTLPRLTQMTVFDATLAPIRFPCYADSSITTVPSNAATFCAYGDLKARRTILLTGDSQAGMWLPALNAIGKTMLWKVVFLAKPGCAPWGNPNPSSFDIIGPVTVGVCNVFNANIQAWAQKNKPQVVLLDGKGYALAPATLPDVATLKSEITTAAATYKAAGSKVIVLSPIPRFLPSLTVNSPGTCLELVTPITNCEFAPSKFIPQGELTAEKAAATAKVISLAVVTPLMCTSAHCALFVKTGTSIHLVFFDQSHINSTYSVFISTALGTILKPLLPA
jgi:hypothetical protein